MSKASSYLLESEGLSLRLFSVIFGPVFCFTGRLEPSLDVDGEELLTDAMALAADAIIWVVVSGLVIQDLPYRR
jgi:hypothetical protein